MEPNLKQVKSLFSSQDYARGIEYFRQRPAAENIDRDEWVLMGHGAAGKTLPVRTNR